MALEKVPFFYRQRHILGNVLSRGYLDIGNVLSCGF